MKLSACIDMFFTEVPFNDRVKAAKEAGFDAVEFWAWHGKDIEGLKAALQDNAMTVAAMCVSSADPEKVARFADKALLVRENAALFAEMVEESCVLAHALGDPVLIVTAGQELSAISRGVQEDNVIHCLKAAAPILEKHGITLVLEPLNVLVDHQGHYLSTSAQAAAILEAVDSPNVKMLFDIYHQQITEGNLIANITGLLPKIGHFHVADVPGRHQPGTGEIHYANVFAAIEAGQYEAFVGCEYVPLGCDSATSALGVMRAAGRDV